MLNESKPSDLSSDQRAMQPYLCKVLAIQSGIDGMRKARTAYLPKFADEKEVGGDVEYEDRLQNTKLTNVFGDIVETLSSKPFEKEVTVENAGVTAPFLENIDGKGNHIHVFAKDLFNSGVSDAVSWVLVDYTKGVREGATVAEERAAGARPYWLHIPSSSVIAVYSERFGGEEVFTHFRYRENVTIREGWEEVEKERIRVYERPVKRDDNANVIAIGAPVWSLQELQKKADKEEWVEIDSGSISLDVIPLVAFLTGKKQGNGWNIKPPLRDAADLQIDLYQEESGLKYRNVLSNYAMLAGQGVNPPQGDNGQPESISIGPNRTLFAPMSGDGQHGMWEWLAPPVEGLRFSLEYCDKTKQDLRELGRQPLTAQSGNITTITAAFAGDKAHTVIEAWAINLKDALENAFKLTAKWLKSNDEPEVSINTDFALSLKENNGLESLDKARERGDISQETWFDEAQRRGTIGPNRTFEDEQDRLIKEMPGDDFEGDPPPEDEENQEN